MPAAAAAPFLALGVVRLLGGIGPLADTGLVSTVAIGDSTVIAAVLAGAACAVALSLPALGSSADLARIRAALGRPFSQTFAQRLGIDVVLLILAGIGLWQLRLYGAPLTRDAQGTLGLDPLLVAAPAFGLAAGAVLATRFVPRLAEIGERTLHRRRGVVAPLGARQLARRPLRYTRTALLLMLAAALGTFAAVYAATWSRSQADQAAYQAGADVRVVATDYPTLPTWAIGPTLRAIDGVQAAVPVSTQSFEVPHVLTDGQLVAFDPTEAAPVMDLPVDASPTGLSSGLDALVAGRPPVVATPIEGAAKRLSVRIDAAIQGQQEFIGGATAPDFPGIRLAIVVQDADGRLHRFAGDATAAITASGQRIEVPLTMTTDGVELTAAPPLWVVGLEITVVPDKDSGDWGTIDIQGIDSSLSTSGDDWTPTSFDASADGLAWSKVLGDNFQIGVSGIQLTVGSDTAPVLGVGLSDTPTGIFLLTTAHADAPLRVVASDAFMAETKAQIGDIVSATSRFADLHVKVVATTPTFPTLGPATPFLIADGPTLAMDRYEARDELDAADQWLLRVDDARSQSVGDAVLQAPISAKQAIVRTTLTHSLEGDPVALGVVGGLGLGALAAIAFAIVGFLVGAVVATRERLGEFALLRGLGLSRRQLVAGLTIENVFLLATGMAAGSGLGLLLAGLVLPFATLDATGAPVVPAPIVVVPWDAIGLTYVFAAGLAVVVVFLAGRQVDARSITAVLRARDE